MQTIYSIPHLAKRLGLTEQSIVDSLAALGQEPVLSIDEKHYYALESASLLQDEVRREDRIRELEKKIGYSELNDIVYPDKSGACGHFGPLERFVDLHGVRPGTDAIDYWAEVESYKNAVRGDNQ